VPAGKQGQEEVANMCSWKHSGVSVEGSARLEAGDQERCTARRRFSCAGLLATLHDRADGGRESDLTAAGPSSARRSRNRMIAARQRLFVAGLAFCHAALNGETSLPNGQMPVGSVAEYFERKSLERHADLRFPRRLFNIMLQRPHCGDRTTRCQRSRY